MRYEVHLNGKRECTAGFEFGVLTAILSWVKRNPAHYEREGKNFRSAEHFCEETSFLSVGGLGLTAESDDKRLQWLNVEIKPGDVIEIRILEPGEVDPPVSSMLVR